MVKKEQRVVLKGGTPLAKLVFVVNPASSAGQTKADFGKFTRIVKQLGNTEVLDVRFTEGPGDATSITRRVLQEGARGVVAVGGDGTLHEVVQGFFHNGVNTFPSAYLGFVPSGTGGDFRRSLGWDKGLEESARRLLAPEIGALDVGMIRLKEKAGASPLARPLQPPVPPGFVGAPPLVPASVPDRQQQQQLSVNGEVYFINVSSVGSSALIAKIANESPKFLGSFITFYQASVRGLVSYKPRNARYRLDGGAWVEIEKVNSIAVCNGKYFGGGMMVSPTADPRDGLLDVTVWAGYGLVDFVLLSNQIYSGKHVQQDKTITLRCSSFEVESDPPFLIEIDGEESPGSTAHMWRAIPRGIRFIQ